MPIHRMGHVALPLRLCTCLGIWVTLGAMDAPRLVGHELLVHAAGRLWHLDHSQSLEDLWQNMSAQELADERIPYWAELWPASLALARVLENRREEICQGACVDLGCGLGFTALVAASLGCNVLACDYVSVALAAAHNNSLVNGVPVNWLCMDWRHPAVRGASVWRLWGADIIYERRTFEPLLSFLSHALAPGGAAWLAEPGRQIFQDFLRMAQISGWAVTCASQQKVNDLYAENILINVWELRAAEE